MDAQSVMIALLIALLGLLAIAVAMFVRDRRIAFRRAEESIAEYQRRWAHMRAWGRVFRRSGLKRLAHLPPEPAELDEARPREQQLSGSRRRAIAGFALPKRIGRRQASIARRSPKDRNGR